LTGPGPSKQLWGSDIRGKGSGGHSGFRKLGVQGLKRNRDERLEQTGEYEVLTRQHPPWLVREREVKKKGGGCPPIKRLQDPREKRFKKRRSIPRVENPTECSGFGGEFPRSKRQTGKTALRLKKGGEGWEKEALEV